MGGREGREGEGEKQKERTWEDGRVVHVGNGDDNCGVLLCVPITSVYIHLCGWMDDFQHVWARKLIRRDSEKA